MSRPSAAPRQTSLLDQGEPAIDRSFVRLVHRPLEHDAWVDHAPGWLDGSDQLFDQLLATSEWRALEMRMYDRMVDQPRLVASWALDRLPQVLADARVVLCERYGRRFESVNVNLYRDGRDSVAWHGDRIPETVHEPVVAIVSLGQPRRLLLRPKLERGRSLGFDLGHGDLLVMGGTSQRTWQHSVPKVSRAGPRMSVTFRHA